MTQQRFLFVCHDAGGTIPPVVALAEELVGRGHEVTILGQPSVRDRAIAAGCSFAAFTSLPDYDRGRALEEQLELTLPALTGPSVGDDLLSLAGAADLVVVDPNLAGALAAAATLDKPSAVLLHSMYKTFVDIWFADIWGLLRDEVNKTRIQFGLEPVASWASLFEGHDRIISPVPTGFEAAVSAPVPESLHNVGFLVPNGATTGVGARFPEGDGPAVLVGLSTTYEHQEQLLQTIIDALGSLPVRAVVTTAGHAPSSKLGNVTVVDFAPHSVLLGEADAMITHAGLGSVAAALSAGVPLICTPIDRDQPLNASRVADLGAGVVVSQSQTVQNIAEAVQRVLSDTTYGKAAQAIAAQSRAEGGAAVAADELESLLG